MAVMKKRTFLLLEILIGLLLVITCIVPLVKQPLKYYKEEMECLERLELERLADWTFTEVKEILLKNEIPWEKIPKKKEQTAHFSLPSASIEIPGNKAKEVARSFMLTGRGEKTGSKGEMVRQLGVYIFLNERKYQFRVPVRRVFVE